MTEDGYCPKHPRREVSPKCDNRLNANKRGYDSRWNRFARGYKIRHPLCVVCELEGRTTETYCPHHLVPVAKGGGVLVGDELLLPVCVVCHARVEGLGLNWRQAIG